MKKKDVKGILRGKVTDFAEKVAPIYELLNWTWGDSRTPPTQGEIEECLCVLIHAFNDEGNCSTGGLEVFHNKEDGVIGIRFTIDDTTFY